MYYYYLNNKLVKKRKPCFDGDKIHLHSKDGVYTVRYATAYYIHLETRTKRFRVKWEDFRCLKGQGISEYKLLKTVNRNIHNVALLLKEIQHIAKKIEL